jgi:threonylcarbamoyladenosine tRNA methylthiotransferase MtaB
VIRLAFATLGCKTNAFDTAAIAGGFPKESYQIVPFDETADIYVINTCTVTGRTDYKSRNLIRKALQRKDLDPQTRVVVTGCFAQRSREEIAAMGAIDFIVDNQSKFDIATIIAGMDYSFQDIGQAQDFRSVPVSGMLERTRAFQKIQDGCDCCCTYCAVPSARGQSRSARLGDVLSQAKLFVASGYKEIVLGGVNLGLFQDGKSGLADVVEALQEIDGLVLIRLSSIEPELWTHGLLTRISRCSKLCPHFHIPLQSGCDSVLKRMGRHYDTRYFKQLIKDILEIFPHAAIGLDVISGFPGETIEEFDSTQSFLQELDIAYLHVFSYSKRSGTPAAVMPDQIPNLEKTRRTNLLTDLSNNKKQLYTSRLIQDRILLRGVIEDQTDGLFSMLSDHYIRCYISQPATSGELRLISPTRTYKDGVI